jgi:rare lipoprotein A
VVVYKPAIATWYGPGFFGHKTACGQRLTRTMLGVANKKLPCGTQVQVSFRGHTVVAPVIDRGPFAHHASWDLTAATAKQLGITVTSRVGAAPLDLSLQPPAL